MNTGIKILDRFTNHYYKLLKSEGFNVEWDDIQGELAVIYTKALNTYRPKIEGDNKMKAEFDTFTSRAFKNAMINFRAKMAKEEFFNRHRVDIDPDTLPDDSDTFPSGEWMRMYFEIKRKWLGMFEGETLLIAKELFDPSEKVLKVLRANLAKFSGRGRGHIKLNGLSGLPTAIALVYDLDVNVVRNYIKIIQKKMKKSVDKK